MSYDHVRGQKLFTLGKSLRGRTFVDVVAEISKCQVVCLRCHRRREAARIRNRLAGARPRASAG